MKKYQCEQCGKQFKNASGLGIHNHYAHGMPSPNSTPEGKKKQSRLYYWRHRLKLPEEEVERREAEYQAKYPGGIPGKIVPAVDARIQKRREYQRQWRKNKQNRKPVQQEGAVPAYLSECPGCRRRFWMTGGQP